MLLFWFLDDNVMCNLLLNFVFDFCWIQSLTCLKKMDLFGSSSLKVIPDLSKAINLEILNLESCRSLVELPSSIQNLHKLLSLDMRNCKSLKILPTGFNLKSLDRLIFNRCSKLKTFPEFSTNISNLSLYRTNIQEFPSNLHLENLVNLIISNKESDGKQWDGAKDPEVSSSPNSFINTSTKKEIHCRLLKFTLVC